MFDRTDTEIIYLPHIVEKLFETYPTQATEAVESGHLALRTRDDLPYGLAIFDERVGIGGYDESMGQMEVFLDTESPIAREWAERVYASVRADSEPLAGDRINSIRRARLAGRFICCRRGNGYGPAK